MQDAIRRAPVSRGLAIAIAATFIGIWLLPDAFGYLALKLDLVGSRPWTLLTHPFAGAPTVSALIGAGIGAYMAWTLGAELEGIVGGRGVAAIWLIGTMLASAGLMVGGLVFESKGIQHGSLPVSIAIMVAWSLRMKGAQASIMGVLPIKVIWLTFLAPLLLIGAPPGGVVSLITTGAFYGWIAMMWFRPLEPTRKKLDRRDDKKLIDFRDAVRDRMKEREEQERLRKLLGDDDRR